MKFYLIQIFTLLLSSLAFSQTKSNYPKPAKGLKMVTVELPKMKDEDNYKVEITFGMESQIGECSKASFSFPEIKTEYLVPPRQWPYYVINAETIEVVEGKLSDCNSTKKVTKKIFSDKKQFENYASSFVRHFYIPESWTVEYRIWKSVPDYTTVK